MKTQLHSPAAPARMARALSHLLARHACLWASLGLLATLASGPPPAQAAVTEAWVQRYTNFSASAVAVDGSGNVVVTGSSHDDYYTAKYAAADGALLWEKRYNGPANLGDAASAVAVDGSGNVVVTGSSVASSFLNWNVDYYTAKYAAADGTLLWEKRYNSPGNSEDYSHALAMDGGGNAVVTGYSRTRSGNDGNDEHYNYYAAKYAAADGALLWEKRYTNGIANAVAVDANGNVVVTGQSLGENSGDYYTAKYATADGALLWEKRYNGPATHGDEARAVAVDGSGNVVVTGNSIGNGSHEDYYTAKYAAVDGALLWEKRSTNSVAAVAVDASGNIVVTGSSDHGIYSDYYTAKYAAADGALLWEIRYNGPANGDDGASSLALGPNGMVAVTGSSSGDYATVVYRENLPPVSIAMDPTGVRLRFPGVPNRSYNIERAPAVTGPWTTINTQTAPASGLLEYLDAPPPPGQAFYRMVQP